MKILGLFNFKFTKYLLAGLVNTIFAFFVYAIFIKLNIHHQFSLLFATIIGVLFNFFNYGKLVFLNSPNKYTFFKFLWAYFVSYFFNFLLLESIVIIFDLNKILSQFFCMPFIILLNWFLLNFWVFRDEKK